MKRSDRLHLARTIRAAAATLRSEVEAKSLERSTVAAALIAAARALGASFGEWKPIDTAEKPAHGSGPHVLLFTPRGNGSVDIGYWYGPDDLWDRGWSSKKMMRSEPPTHWMPLPPHPR